MATAKFKPLDMKLEVVVLGVSDVEHAKAFYAKLGWRLDADHATGADGRVVQMTPHNSDASIIFGKGIASAKPGLADGLVLAVLERMAAGWALDFTSLINAARELLPQVMRPAAAPCILNDTMLSPNTPFPDLNRAALSFVVAYMLVVCEPAIREWEAAERVA